MVNPRDELPAVVRKMMDPTGSGREIIPLYRTYAHNPRLFVPRQLQSFHINSKTTLSLREKEMTLIRITYLSGGDYPWAEHVANAGKNGITDDEVSRLSSPDSTGWSGKEAALVQAIDDIHAADRISDQTWTALTPYYSDSQILDLLVAAAGYRMTAMSSNSFGV